MGMARGSSEPARLGLAGGKASPVLSPYLAGALEGFYDIHHPVSRHSARVHCFDYISN